LGYPSLTRSVATSFEEAIMTDALWLGVVTMVVFGYLLYALLVPEKF
jgi:K+-transporting ATPase KdpF subunit